jgi:hypothetical protein
MSLHRTAGSSLPSKSSTNTVLFTAAVVPRRVWAEPGQGPVREHFFQARVVPNCGTYFALGGANLNTSPMAGREVSIRVTPRWQELKARGIEVVDGQLVLELVEDGSEPLVRAAPAQGGYGCGRLTLARVTRDSHLSGRNRCRSHCSRLGCTAVRPAAQARHRVFYACAAMHSSRVMRENTVADIAPIVVTVCNIYAVRRPIGGMIKEREIVSAGPPSTW